MKEEFEKFKTSKRKRLLSEMKMNEKIKELVEQVSENATTFGDLLNESDCLDVLNRVQMNKFLNVYLNNILQNIVTTQQINSKLIDKILKRKEVIPQKDYVKLYLESRKLENEHLKLVDSFCKAQEVKLDISEQNILIIYRSLPPHLQKLLYNTILEFVRKCPAIQREMAKRQGEIQAAEFDSQENQE